jgi:hypothetical protein
MATAVTRTRDQGKSMFVKEFLNDNPQATHKVVSEAWKKAGMEGTVSETTVSKLRKQMGLVGNSPKGRKPASGKGAAMATKAKVAKKGTRKTGPKVSPAPAKAPSRPDRTRMLEEVEVGIDGLIFRLVEVGGMEDIEDGLRRVRRQLVLSHGR